MWLGAIRCRITNLWIFYIFTELVQWIKVERTTGITYLWVVWAVWENLNRAGIISVTDLDIWFTICLAYSLGSSSKTWQQEKLSFNLRYYSIYTRKWFLLQKDELSNVSGSGLNWSIMYTLIWIFEWWWTFKFQPWISYILRDKSRHKFPRWSQQLLIFVFFYSKQTTNQLFPILTG